MANERYKIPLNSSLYNLTSSLNKFYEELLYAGSQNLIPNANFNDFVYLTSTGKYRIPGWKFNFDVTNHNFAKESNFVRFILNSGEQIQNEIDIKHFENGSYYTLNVVVKTQKKLRINFRGLEDNFVVLSDDKTLESTIDITLEGSDEIQIVAAYFKTNEYELVDYPFILILESLEDNNSVEIYDISICGGLLQRRNLMTKEGLYLATRYKDGRWQLSNDGGENWWDILTKSDVHFIRDLAKDVVEVGLKTGLQKGIDVWFDGDKLNFDVHDFKLKFQGDVSGEGEIRDLTDTRITLQVNSLNGIPVDDFALKDLSNVLNEVVLEKVKEVDGPNSGLNADLLDDYHAEDFALRDLSNVENHDVLNKLLPVDGSGSGLDADMLDGFHASHFAVDDEVVHKTGDEQISGHKTFNEDVTINGNLYVVGETVNLNVTNLNIEDNVIVLNKGENTGGVSAIYAGIEVERTPSKPAKLVYDETDDRWKVDFGDEVLRTILVETDTIVHDEYFFKTSVPNVLSTWRPKDSQFTFVGGVEIKGLDDNDVYLSFHHAGAKKLHFVIDGDVYVNEGLKLVAYNDLENVENETVRDKVDAYFLRKDQTSIPTANEVFDLGNEDYHWNRIYAKLFYGTAYESMYADIAEKYILSEDTEPGDVVVVTTKPEYEGEKSNEIGSLKVLGVVSENPGFLMNRKEKGKPVALKGKVKCKVKGPVKKGDILVSYYDGYAISLDYLKEKGIELEKYAIVGIALEDGKDEKIFIKV